MLTIFSTPRPFNGQFSRIQENAVRSWLALVPRPDVILFGDESGTAELAERLGVRHVRAVATNELGTMLLSDMFAQAQALARSENLVFVNADIILTSSIIDAIAVVAASEPSFLVVGQRTDLDLDSLIDFDAPDWEAKLLQRAAGEGRLEGPLAIDYFGFPRGLFRELPPFPVARTSYDNWLIWHAASLGARVVDASARVTAIHQHHGYQAAGGYIALWEGPEARRSREMVGHWSRYHTVADASLMIRPDGSLSVARGLKYRLASPRRALGAALSFTRPIRRRLRREK